MNPLVLFKRPEYLFRPSQVLKRFQHLFQRPSPVEIVHLPWGARLQIRPHETIGAGIYAYGLFDLLVCEAIRRLLKPGSIALDIGANIGQMTTLMSLCVGSSGCVHSFEPNPEIIPELEFNVNLLSKSHSISNVKIHPVALTSYNGDVLLDLSNEWENNRGMSRVVTDRSSSSRCYSVKAKKLDDIFSIDNEIDLLKVDIEGHEQFMLEGAVSLLKSGKISNIIFEDFQEAPSRSMLILEASGYQIFKLESDIIRPKLLRVNAADAKQYGSSGRDYLATLRAESVAHSYKDLGWKVFKRI